MEVKGILGHKSVGSTSRYLHVAAPERARAMAKHPINDFLPALLGKEQGSQL
jgi:hypothetical protein